jgi:DNA-binding PadR family transcriptional regulator
VASPPAAESFLPLKHDVVMILIALSAQPRHGYGIIQDVERRSAGASTLQAGALYRTLKRLLADGLIVEVDPPRNADREDERRRYYELTRLGGRVLAAELERMARLVRDAGVKTGVRRPRLA